MGYDNNFGGQQEVTVRWSLSRQVRGSGENMSLLKQAGLVVAERHGQWTFYRRDEDAIPVFLTEVEKELLKP